MAPFSNRIPRDLRPNRLTEVRTQLGFVDHDLTLSNPTRCGLPYPHDLLSELGHPDGLQYDPDPRGSITARRAIARWYRRFDVAVDATRIVLTASTSEAYGVLMRLLADPGERIAVPCPSYPLLEQLARLEALGLAYYRLALDDGWRIEPGSLAALPVDCRAVVAVHPNNPTGSFLHPVDSERLVALCAERQLALVVDEVFLPYRLTEAPGSEHSLAGTTGCLTFTLGGLSKSVGLPQLKLAWIVVSGATDQVEAALERLEYVTDAYLSVSTPVALAAPRLLERGRVVESAILDRCRSNLARLQASVTAASPISVLAPCGGWSAILRVPSAIGDERLAIHLLERHGVAVHPGYLFDLPGDGFLVVSLLPPEVLFTEGIRRLVTTVDELLRDLPDGPQGQLENVAPRCT